MNAVLRLAAPDIDRKTYLGGSDVAGIFGVSPWATPADVYFRKKGDEAQVKIDPMRERIYKRGKRLEPVVIEMLEEELGILVTKVSTQESPNRYIDAEYPFMAAEIDFEWEVRQEDIVRFPWARDLVVGSTQNGEIKTVAPFPAVLNKWGDMDTDEVPIEYAFQSMHGLAVTKRQVCMYGTLFGSDNLVTYAVGSDAETIADMRRRLVMFWENHVLLGVPPPPLTLADLQRMYLKPSLAKIDADEATREFVAKLHAVMDQEAVVEARKKELQFQLENFMREHEALVDGNKVLATWKASKYSRLDDDALKAAHPTIYDEFYKSRPTRRFSLTGRRGR